MLYESNEEAGENTPNEKDTSSIKSLGLGTWILTNLDTGEMLISQFPPSRVSTEYGTVYALGGAMNRDEEIVQWVKGKSEVLQVEAMLYSLHSDHDIGDQIKVLRAWTKRDSTLQRPPLMAFEVGDGTVALPSCIMESVGNVEFMDFKISDGKPRSVSFVLNLREYTPFLFEEGATGETRWARAKNGDYYEKLCEREYNDPMLGDVIRKQNPDMPTLELGDVVKLPSAAKMRGQVVQPSSIPFLTAFGRKSTAQRTRRIEMFLARNRSFVSHVVKG